MNQSDYRNIHAGEDAFILGSGKSIDFYNSEFFRGRLTIAVNDGATGRIPDPTFIVTKYHEHAHEFRDKHPGSVVVVSRMQHGHEGMIVDMDRLVVVDTSMNTMHRWVPEDFPDDPDVMVASWSSITTAMHWAAFMGCRAIFLVGADCGTIDGQGKCDGYPDNGDQEQFWPLFEKQTIEVARILRDRYGCVTVNLSPFASPNMDGHAWVSHAGRLN
ncbi:MAG: hypothetical protein ACYCZR_03055 [Burkholderiales bacterium]